MLTTLKSLTVVTCMLVLSACGGGSKTSTNPVNPIVNRAPVVNAGTDATTRLPDTLALDGTVSDDGLPAGAVVSTAWSVSSGPAGATFADVNAIDTIVTFVSEGTYVLQLTADDSALQTNDSVTVTVQAAPALSDIVVTPSIAALTSGATQQFVASGSDQYGAAFPAVATWSATGGTIDAAGLYTAGGLAGAFAVTATDGSVSNIANVTISASPPIADAGGPYVGVEGSAVALDGSGSTDANNDITDYDWDLDNDGAYDDATGVAPTFMAGGSGVFTIGLRVTDTDGAASVDITTVTVSNVAPVANEQSVSTGEDTAVAIMLTGSDPGNTPLTYTIAGQPSNGVLSGAAPNITYTPNSNYNGSDSFTFTVNDGTVDSLAATVSITVSAANDAPMLDPIGNKLVDELNLLTFTATATDVDLPADGLTFTLADGAGGSVPTGAAITAGGGFTWTPTELQGSNSYTFDVVVTDDGTGLLSASETITITVAEVNVAPVLTVPAPPVSINELVAFGFTATATDADDPVDGLTFTLADGAGGSVPAGAAITTGGDFTWTPTEAQGPNSYTFDVVVTDDGAGLLSASETITIRVADVNMAPVLTVPPLPASIDELVAFEFTATATDANLPVETLTFTLAGGAGGSVPAGATITAGGDFTWTPTEAQGPNSYTFDIVVTDDGTGTLSASETITGTLNNNVLSGAYWTLDEGTLTTAADSFGTSDGTIVGATWTAGVSGTALDFSSTGDHVAVDDPLALNITGTEISMAAWINPRDGGSSNFSRIISKWSDDQSAEVFAMMMRNYRLRFHVGDEDMDSSHIVRLNDWVHVAMVYDGADMRIYVNGDLDLAIPVAKTDPIIASVKRVHIGNREDLTSNRKFIGILDEVQIYDRALDLAEIGALYAAFVPPAPAAGLFFTDITVDAGLSALADGGHGVMFAGVDNDSDPDLYLTNNLENNSNRAEQFYVNDTGVTFTEVGVLRGVADEDGGSHGAAWADFDNDGDYDLVNGTTWDNGAPSRGNPDNNNVFENDGAGSFTENTDADIAATATETRGIVAFDMDGDGDLDLFSVSGSQNPGVKEAYRNDLVASGDDIGTLFSPWVGGDLTSVIIPTTQGVTDTDFDGDGDIDILAGNRGDEPGFDTEFAILRNDGTGNFTRVLPLADLGISDIARDGVTSADIDNDGDLDLLLSSDGISHLYRNDGNNPPNLPTYTKLANFFSGTEGYMGGFADLDNDGDQDLVFAGDEHVFLNQGDGSFTFGQSVPVAEIGDPRAIAFADIDGDGDLDFAIAAKDSRSWLVQNDWDDAVANKWIKIRLVSSSGQAGAFGAKTFVYPVGQGLFHPGNLTTELIGMRESGSNQGYLSQDDPVLHFGLGLGVTVVDIVVEFVDGSQRTCTNVATNVVKLIDETAVDPCNP